MNSKLKKIHKEMVSQKISGVYQSIREALNSDQIEKVGKDAGLSGKDLSNFVSYVTKRGFTRDDYYIREWAKRFANGREYAMSDAEGRKLLQSLDNKYKGMEIHPEAIKPGDKVHCPSGYCKVLSVSGNKIIVRGEEGDHEYDISQTHKESSDEKDFDFSFNHKDWSVQGEVEDGQVSWSALNNKTQKNMEDYGKKYKSRDDMYKSIKLILDKQK